MSRSRDQIVLKCREAVKAVFMRLREYRLSEARLIQLKVTQGRGSDRLNLVLPCLSVKRLFGGAATALRLFEALRGRFDRARIIVLEENENQFEPEHWAGWTVEGHSAASKSTIAFMANSGNTLNIENTDMFIATHWITAYQVRQIMLKLGHAFPGRESKYIYLIQDFEPAFNPWSSQYLIADSTYTDGESTLAVFNTKILMDYFRQQGYSFNREFCFEPKLNEKLASLRGLNDSVQKERLVLVYGRPSSHRNAFELVVEALHHWSSLFDNANRWQVISLGERHKNIEIGRGLRMQSLGKVSMQEYGSLLSRASVGLSLMVSPHPSYPPLEMADFGLRVVTNRFAGKDLSQRSENITSVADASPIGIAKAMTSACEEFELRPWGHPPPEKSAFLSTGEEFPFLQELYQELTGALQRTRATGPVLATGTQ